jgi:hypothetical protein
MAKSAPPLTARLTHDGPQTGICLTFATEAEKKAAADQFSGRQ